MTDVGVYFAIGITITALFNTRISMDSGWIKDMAEGSMTGPAVLMLLAFLIYNDGILTIIRMATIYGQGIGLGTGEQMQRPLAITIIGGLSIATFLTLFLTPVVYEMLHRRTDKEY